MKSFFVLLLLFLMATQAFSKWVMLLEYQWNKVSIAANLCENKASPKLKCEGKCQVAKAMAQDENKNTPARQQKSKFTETLFAFTVQLFVAGVPNEDGITSSSLEKNLTSHIPLNAVFRPPMV